MTSRIFAALATTDVHHHALTVDVADFQVGQLGAPSAGGVEGHEQDAFARSARCMVMLRALQNSRAESSQGGFLERENRGIEEVYEV